MPERLRGELDERLAMASRALSYHQSFLQDYLRGILPYDLVILSAPTGLGKTELALWIASCNARLNKRVHYFALEAEPRELERRRKYAIVSRLAYRDKHPDASTLSYTDWLMGNCEHIVGAYNAMADAEIAQQFFTLNTFYRGSNFTAETLSREISRVADATDLIVVDHLHYIDDDGDRDEQRALGDAVKTIRDVALLIGKPIILVAHLRKKDRRFRQLIAELDDVHGSSNVTKISTQVITIERATDIDPSAWYMSPTYVAILKDRRAGAPRVVAVQEFDTRTKIYAAHYTLGRVKGAKWEQIGMGDVPRWALHHRPMVDGEASRQEEMRAT